MKTIEMYTDGACSYNPGPGGWAAILKYNGMEKEFSGFKNETTNNQMELLAVIEGLKKIKEPCNVIVYTDSAYVFNAFENKWLVNWQLNNWKTSTKKPVLNKELWQDLLIETARHNVTWVKVKGHSDNEYNNKCDVLARKQIENNILK